MIIAIIKFIIYSTLIVLISKYISVSYTHLDVYKRQETWWVWIPRYAHSSGANHTEIKFIDINLSLIHILQ